MSLSRHAVANLHVGDELANFDDIAGEFVSDNKGRLAATARPLVPFKDVDVRATNPGSTHADEDFVVENGGYGDVGQLEPRTGVMFDEGLHSGKGRKQVQVQVQEQSHDK